MTGSANPGWEQLPAAVRRAVERHAGPVTGASPAGQGVSTAVRLILRTAEGRVFIKGTGPGSDDLQRGRLALGAALAPHVTALSPPLLFRVQASGWDITGWPALPGQPRADLRPGSPDIPKLTVLLARLGTIPAPAAVPMRSADKDWGTPEHPGLLAGDMLVHTDPNPANFVVHGNRAWLTDWGWAMRGPAWLTAARLVLFLIEAGWEPRHAENALMDVPAWGTAPPRAVTAYALASAPAWEKAHKRHPGNDNLRRWRGIARAWADHRASLTRN